MSELEPTANAFTIQEMEALDTALDNLQNKVTVAVDSMVPFVTASRKIKILLAKARHAAQEAAEAETSENDEPEPAKEA